MLIQTASGSTGSMLDGPGIALIESVFRQIQ